LNRRVVVTGLGLVTPVGNTLETTWAALLKGQSGADFIKKFDAARFAARFACEVKNFNPLDYIEKKEARKMGAFIHYAIAASDEAVKGSGLKITDDIAEDIGTYISSGIGDFWAIEREHEKLLKDGPSRVSPFFIPSAIVNLASGQVSIRHNAKGPNSATATACSAGAHAIGDSFKIIQRGDAEAMICGGAESAITPMSVAGFAALRALSTRNDDPIHASRPFDLTRDGFVIGEGAGIVVLEELEHAKRRGAKIYAELTGYAANADAHHITAPAPEGEGAQRCMKLALKDARLSPADIGYINAHGTSTKMNDANETLAIKKVFGDAARKVMVSSTKSMTGHMLGAAGGVETAVCALALARGAIPPTINYTTPDPECDLDYVPNTAREVRVNNVITNSFGFGGTNACLVLSRFS
jgi:3-oxoacyl-[acyl-carrier-protein] synthase II